MFYTDLLTLKSSVGFAKMAVILPRQVIWPTASDIPEGYLRLVVLLEDDSRLRFNNTLVNVQ